MTYIFVDHTQKLVQNWKVPRQSYIPICEVEDCRRRDFVRDPESLDLHRESQRVVINQKYCVRSKGKGSERFVGKRWETRVLDRECEGCGNLFTSSKHDEICMQDPVI